ncbi:MAG TPA: cold shock domain-containing protein [Acidimicrobiales bacterium]|nr:cold shock domain-containing protein [Acidimicrobiales bacterium]
MRTASFGDAAGAVRSFDKSTGLGEVTSTDGATYPFHCTAIADGTRDIEVGQQVTFTITAGHLGKLEATDIRK